MSGGARISADVGAVMACLWTWNGRYFGCREADDLWTYSGIHVGRFQGNSVYYRDGRYLGVVVGSRLVVKTLDRSVRSRPFPPHVVRRPCFQGAAGAR